MGTNVSDQDGNRFRQITLEIPKVMYDRIEAVLAQVVEQKLLNDKVLPREFILGTILVNGLAMVEADLKNRERRSALVVTPQEDAAMQENLRKAGVRS